jgi:hypothetical protein
MQHNKNTSGKIRPVRKRRFTSTSDGGPVQHFDRTATIA